MCQHAADRRFFAELLHGHDHGHGHASCRDDARGANQRRLGWMLVLVVLYMLAEVVGGVLSNSLALLADAGHMLSDAAALALSFVALWVARRPATSRNTFGYHRIEILAALVNGATLVGVSALIVVEAVQRLGRPPEVDAPLMMGIATGGLLINLAGLWILHGGARDNLNLRGAWLHVLSDALGSVAVILAAGCAWAFGWHWADPAISIVVAVLMEAAPGHLDVDQIRRAILDVPGVLRAERLHVWTITSGVTALSVHVGMADGSAPGELLVEIRRTLRERFGVEHITVQLEPEGAPVGCCAGVPRGALLAAHPS